MDRTRKVSTSRMHIIPTTPQHNTTRLAQDHRQKHKPAEATVSRVLRGLNTLRMRKHRLAIAKSQSPLRRAGLRVYTPLPASTGHGRLPSARQTTLALVAQAETPLHCLLANSTMPLSAHSEVEPGISSTHRLVMSLRLLLPSPASLCSLVTSV
jgi:hypothetical protein